MALQQQQQLEEAEEMQARALKRPRLVWTPQLHKVFEEAVQKIGVNKAVPKTIMQVCMDAGGVCEDSQFEGGNSIISSSTAGHWQSPLPFTPREFSLDRSWRAPPSALVAAAQLLIIAGTAFCGSKLTFELTLLLCLAFIALFCLWRADDEC